MTEESGEHQDPYDINRFLDTFLTVYEGHQNEQGTLSREDRPREVAAKVSSVGTKAYSLINRDHAPEEIIRDFADKALGRIIAKYPQEADRIAKAVGENKYISPYSNEINKYAVDVINSLTRKQLEDFTDVELVNLVRIGGDRNSVVEKMRKLPYKEGFRLRLAQSLVFGAGEVEDFQKMSHVIGTTWAGIIQRLDYPSKQEEKIKLDEARSLMDQSVVFIKENLPGISEEDLREYFYSDRTPDAIQKLIEHTGFSLE